MYRKNFTNLHTGFLVEYEDGTFVREKDFYLDKEGQRRATNWSEINLNKIKTLTLFWKGSDMVKISKEDLPDLSPSDWYFTCSGTTDINNPEKPVILGRNIGYKQNGILFIFSVDESSGRVKTSTRKA